MIETRDLCAGYGGYEVLHGVTPGSYTHLDVYKRQPYEDGFRALGLV